VLRSDDTDARKEARRCFGRSDRRAQGDRPRLRSIRPTRARRPSDASVDPTEARKHVRTPDKPSRRVRVKVAANRWSRFAVERLGGIGTDPLRLHLRRQGVRQRHQEGAIHVLVRRDRAVL